MQKRVRLQHTESTGELNKVFRLQRLISEKDDLMVEKGLVNFMPDRVG